MAIALILKSISGSNLTAVYKKVGIYNGWITESNNENNTEYIVNIIKSNRNQLLHITYKLHKNINYQYLPFYIGDPMSKSIIGAPNWLTSLNNALEMKTKDSWEKFISDAKQISISKKSISSTYEKLQ